MTLSDASRINRILSERGILESAVANGWQAQGERGWRYPVFDLAGQAIGYRVKQIDRDPKYLWSPAKPQHPFAEWYILPETSRAIAAHGGLCYLANGEPALHAYHSGGIKHSIATTLSEISVPANVIDILQQLGVTRLVSIVDNDYAGYQAAIKWRDALRGSGIDFEACTWGKVQSNKVYIDDFGNEHPYIACDDIEPKIDGNDVWKLTAFDNTAFQTWIADVIPLPLPVPQEKPQQVAQEYDKTPQGLLDAILNAASASGLKGRGKWLNGKSIFREEKKPSFGISKEHGYGKDLATGEIYSTFTVAERLNIDWKAYYPKQLHSKKSQQQKQREAETLETAHVTQKEKVLAAWEQSRWRWTTEAAIDELSVKAMACQVWGQYKSWWTTKTPPKGMISAILNLSKSRSETARVLCLLHDAFRRGLINWAMFTIADIEDVLNVDPRVLRSALKDLQEWSLVRLLSGGYLKEILHSETALNYFSDYAATGKKPQWYTLNFDMDEIAGNIYTRLETVMLEKIHRRTYARRSSKIAESLGVETVQDLRPLQQRSEIVMQTDMDSKAAANKFQLEMEGDGVYWHGWQSELHNPTAFPIDMSQCENIQELRAQLLIHWITEVCGENTREDLRRLIGGSDGTLQTLYEDYHIDTEQQYERVEVVANFRDLRPVLREKQQQYRGMVRKISFKYRQKKGWDPQLLESAPLYYAKDSYKITKVWMLICKPSKQRMMTDEEIAIKVVTEAAQMSGPEVIEPEKKTGPMAITSPAPVSPRKKFSHFQAKLDVFMFTPYKLVSDIVLDDKQNVIYKAPSDVDLMRWLADNAQVRLHEKRTGKQKIALLKDVKATPDGYELRPYRMSCEIHGKPFVDTDGETMRVLNGKRDKQIEALEQKAQAPVILQQKVMEEKAPRELSEYDRRTLDFIQRRWEREHKEHVNRFEWIRKYDNRDEKAA